ncbi:hypothetical protein OHA98_41385, partial [Streptomyces sp. NBC_00654]|uniref:hypothetical protein n=1 Tax=Streptomyces sp. NBC_00654 TaxID=2975799 RepID=UPI002258A997
MSMMNHQALAQVFGDRHQAALQAIDDAELAGEWASRSSSSCAEGERWWRVLQDGDGIDVLAEPGRADLRCGLHAAGRWWTGLFIAGRDQARAGLSMMPPIGRASAGPSRRTGPGTANGGSDRPGAGGTAPSMPRRGHRRLDHQAAAARPLFFDPVLPRSVWTAPEGLGLNPA